jgi:hypothetical protein
VWPNLRSLPITHLKNNEQIKSMKLTNGSFDFTNCTIFIVSSSSSISTGISGRWGKKSFWATASCAHIKLYKILKGIAVREIYGHLCRQSVRRRAIKMLTWKCGVCNRWKSSRQYGLMWQRGASISRISRATFEHFLKWIFKF